MLPSYPYPSINSLQKRSSIASERPYLHRYALSSHDVGLHSTSSTSVSASNSSNGNSISSGSGNGSVSASASGSISIASGNGNGSTVRNGGHKPAAAGKNKAAGSAAGFASYPVHALDSYAGSTGGVAADVYTSSYTSHYPLYGLDWAVSRDESLAKVALSSYREDSTNKLEILYGEPQFVDEDNNISDAGAATATATSPQHVVNSWSFAKYHDYTIKYPITRLQWDPAMSLLNTDVERLATTSECLRIYEVIKPADYSGPSGPSTGYLGTSPNTSTITPAKGKLVEKTALTNSKSKNLNQLPPMTSFDWNRFDPANLITCSIDTTCTVWNLTKETFVAKTQLIAHDSEVYDVKYIYGDTNVFASCSSDGSVRLFDLRNLDQSTIIYERSDSVTPAPTSTPAVASPADNTGRLVRLATSNYNANQIAVLEANSSRILVLDLRNVGMPLYTLQSHSSPVNSIAWHPTKNMLLSGGDDCQVLVHDLTGASPESHHQGANHPEPVHSQDQLPSYSFSTDMEVNGACWSPDGSWVGVNTGKHFQACQL